MAMFKDVIKLVNVTITKDDSFQEIEIKSERTVFANKRSVSQKEFFEAGRNDLKAQYVFDVRLSEYQGEKELIFNNAHYSIYRTYERGENIELYCEKRLGVS